MKPALILAVVVACHPRTPPPPSEIENQPIDPPGRPPVQPVVLPLTTSAHVGRLVGQPLVSTAPGCEATIELHALDNAATCAAVVKTDHSVTVVDTLSLCEMADASHRVQPVRATCSYGDLTIEFSVGFYVQCNAKACTRPSDQAFERSPDRAHSGFSDFLGVVEDVVAAHDWKKLLALASTSHKQSQLVEMKQDEATYLAELLGIHTVGNSISKGRVTFADLDSIRSIEVAEVSDTKITGLVHLTSGATLHLYMAVVKEGDHFVLTGGVG